jgi:hypothetical protein
MINRFVRLTSLQHLVRKACPRAYVRPRFQMPPEFALVFSKPLRAQCEFRRHHAAREQRCGVFGHYPGQDVEGVAT